MDSREDYETQILVGLDALARIQKPILETLGYYDTSTETLSRYGLALSIEVSEFLNETPWKAWKKNSSKEPDPERMMQEFADLMLFIAAWINYLNLLGMSPEDLAQTIMRVLDENYERFQVNTEGTNAPV